MPPAPAFARHGALAALPEESPANQPSGAADERLPLAELAAGAAILERIVRSRDLPRFQALCQSEEGIRARLSFAWDPSGPVRIDGALTTRLAMQCHRCLKAVPVHLRSAFSVLAVEDEAEASRLGAERDVLRIASPAPRLAELIEDELLLALPAQPCAQSDCARRPPMAYPPAGLSAGHSRNPFEAIKALKNNSLR